MRPRPSAVIATVLALVVLATAVSFANSRSARDPAGDVKHNPPGDDARNDIVRISFGHGPGGALVQTVTTKGRVVDPSSRTAAPPLLWIDVPGKVAQRAGCQFSDYFVIAGEVDQCGDGPKVGPATVKRVDAHTLQFTFAAKTIRNPKQYGIAFVTEGSTGGRLVFFDRAPDQGFLVHKLR
jgi:hypothetical protein